jgi:predicted hotdog family 3-hydroxylacyl-ACP dehydratase
MVMISSLVHADELKTATTLHIEPGNIFVSNGVFSESGMVENIAQTAAAGVGYQSRQQQKEVPVGFIAAIRDLSIHELPLAGTEISTETVITNHVMDVSIVHGTIKQHDRVLATCEMRIFLKPDSAKPNA